MHTDTETLYTRVVYILRAHDRGDITADEAEDLVDLEEVICARDRHARNYGGDEAA